LGTIRNGDPRLNHSFCRLAHIHSRAFAALSKLFPATCANVTANVTVNVAENLMSVLCLRLASDGRLTGGWNLGNQSINQLQVASAGNKLSRGLQASRIDVLIEMLTFRLFAENPTCSNDEFKPKSRHGNASGPTGQRHKPPVQDDR